MRKVKRLLISLVFVLAMTFSLAAFNTGAAGKVPTEEEVYNAIIALKSSYPEGMPWTNDNFHSFNGGIYSGGYGCAGFAFACSDAAFDRLPAREIDSGISISMLHVGDIIRIRNSFGGHSVVVLEKKASSVVICEGNYNSSIHWGRVLTAGEVEAAEYVMTRYPEGVFAADGHVHQFVTTPAPADSNLATKVCSICKESKTFTTIDSFSSVWWWNGNSGFGSITSAGTPKEGGVRRVTADTFSPGTADSKELALSSSDETVVKTDGTTFTYVGAGTATLTLYAVDRPSVYKTYTVTVAHDYIEDPVVTKEATCTETGLKTGKCSQCGIVTEEIATKAHTRQYQSAVAATCTEAGHKAGYICSVCDAVISGMEPIAPLGHTTVVLTGKAATCTTDGLTDGSKCGRCNEILVAQEVIPALGHDEMVLEAEEATCTTSGLKEGSKCKRCGDILVVQEVIPALGHDEKILPAVEATCTTAGMTEGKECKRCGETLVAQETVPALGHDEQIINGKEATCTASGMTEGKECKRCGEILEAQTTIPALGHDEKVLEAEGATCENAGKTEGKECKRCGEILVAQEVIPALGHHEVFATEVAPTCTEVGMKEGRMCDRCGKVFSAQDPIPALGHDEQVIAGKEATCTTSGLTEGKKCNRCGEILVVQETIAALGHNEKTLEAVEATCTTSGFTEGKKCDRCDTVFIEQMKIDALGHDEEVIDGKEATCTVSGLTKGRKCKRCNADLAKQTVIPALGHHKVVTVEAAAATVLKPGTTEGSYCDRCGETLVTAKEIPQLESKITLVAKTVPMQYGKKLDAKKLVKSITEGDRLVSCTSKATKYVKVSGATTLVAAKKAGSSQITLKFESGKTAVVTIKVQKAAVATTSITVNKTAVPLKVKKSFKLVAKVTPITSTQKITYSSSNKKVATVSSTGIIKGVKKGTATITVKSGKKFKKVKVTVK